MKIKSIAFLIVLLAGIETMNGQTVYSIDASKIKNANLQSGHLKMGNPGPEGSKIEINNRYMTLNGKPIIPVMGEMHFSRVAKDQWEDRILKMKACGVNIIACYVLWIHHEEIEGRFDWNGNKDLGAFVELCAKHGLWVYPRIGPWCHAEVRNGGTPDWVLKKEHLKDRSNDPIYQRYAEEWYRQVALQLKGLMYKDGGPVVGVQLENEYGRGKQGEAHILWLKHTAQKYGIDVPMYTVTGWGNGSVPPYEVIPLWGAYPDEPWAANLLRNKDCQNFKFSSFRNDENIGNDVNKAKESYIDYSAYPFFTCEVGVGIENTDHRRLQIGSLDGYGLILAKIGSGSNLPGYYMFTGGSNPHGLLTSMEENREETGYWNTNPIISYDFQAAIRESGELNGNYFEIKKLHYFLNEFGDRLAPMEPVFTENKDGFQAALRVQDKRAFLFGINYCRHNLTSGKKNVQFNINVQNETLQFPSRPINISDSSFIMWPVNFSMENILLKYATAQPLCAIGNRWIFIEDADSSPEFCFDSLNIQNVSVSNGKVNQKNGRYIVSNLKPGFDCVITVRDKNNQEKKILILSKEEAKQAWLFKEGDKKYFFISKSGMYVNNGKLHVFDTVASFTLKMLDEQNNTTLFKNKTYTVPGKKININYKESFLPDKAKWLKTGTAELNEKNQLWHRFFLQDFSLNNPAYIKTATLFIAPQSYCRLQINNIWVNQEISADASNKVDLTGYLKKGENRLLIDFPFEAGQKAFAAKLKVEFGNADLFEIYTDSSWLTKDAYTFPSYLSKSGGYKPPDILVVKNAFNKNFDGKASYAISLPANYPEDFKNLYLKINYSGDKAKLYFNHRLIADDFNNGSTWTIGLNNFNDDLRSGNLQLEIDPRSANAKIYFDDVKAGKNSAKATLQNLQLVPQYETTIDISNL
ncbi:hypothetical protein BH11BAC3_BH11BAC3_35730 [soil metagenome]